MKAQIWKLRVCRGWLERSHGMSFDVQEVFVPELGLVINKEAAFVMEYGELEKIPPQRYRPKTKDETARFDDADADADEDNNVPDPEFVQEIELSHEQEKLARAIVEGIQSQRSFRHSSIEFHFLQV